MAAGNIIENDLIEIRNSPEMQHCRRLQKRGEEDSIALCSKCTLPRQTLFEVIGAVAFSEEVTRRLMSMYEKWQFYK